MSDSERTVFAPRAGAVSVGTTLNGIYEVERLIAVGGMGEVYKGRAIQTGDAVAIKMIRPELARDEAARVADATEGFSFAYLKELVLSSMMTWISDGRQSSFAAVMEGNAVFLLSQMMADPVPTPEVLPPSEDFDED